MAACPGATAEAMTDWGLGKLVIREQHPVHPPGEPHREHTVHPHYAGTVENRGAGCWNVTGPLDR